MNPISNLLMKPALIVTGLLLFSPPARAEVHPQTASPSLKYRLASENVYQKSQGVAKQQLGAVVSLIAKDGAVLSKCFHPGEAYPTIDAAVGKEFATTGNWNKDETLVAVGSGGRTWSKVDFYAVKGGRISILPHPDSEIFLSENLTGYSGRNTRLYESFIRWTGSDTFVMNFSGTAVLNEGQPETHPTFEYEATMRISMEGIEVISFQKK